MFWLSGQLIGLVVVALCILIPFAIFRKISDYSKKQKVVPVQRCPQPCLKHNSCLPLLVEPPKPEVSVAWANRPKMVVPGKFSALYPKHDAPLPRVSDRPLPPDLHLWR